MNSEDKISDTEYKKDHIIIHKIISKLNSDKTKFSETLDHDIYGLDKKLLKGINKIIYIGSELDIDTFSVITNQSRLLDFIPKMYEQGNRVAEYIIENKL